MRSVLMGTTGVHVSQLCFGTMTFGGDADEATSKAVYARTRDAGITFYDCASSYAGGKSEEIVGRLIKGHREELVLTSKYSSRNFPSANGQSAGRRNLKQRLEDTLRRMGTDYIDVYFVHRVDWDTPVEETVRALDDMVKQGKILYAAVSNWPAWRIMKALSVAEREGRTGFKLIQPLFNLLKRQVQSEILPMAQSEGLGVISYSPIAGGFLSGKYSGGAKPEVGRLLTNADYAKRYGDGPTGAAAEAFLAFAKKEGYHPVSLAVAWVGATPGITCPIIGARTVAQLEDSLKSTEIEMTPDLYQTISDLGLPIPMPTDRVQDLPGH